MLIVSKVNSKQRKKEKVNNNQKSKNQRYALT